MPGVTLRELRDLAKLRLRVRPGAAAIVAEALAAASAATLPLAPNQVTGDPRLSIAWTAPGAWLALGEVSACRALAEAVAGLRAGAAVLATPVSSGLCALEVSGPRSAELLACGCPLDLDGGAVGEGGCAASLFFQTPIFLQRSPGSGGYVVVVDRAVAWSLWAALVDNARLLRAA